MGTMIHKISDMFQFKHIISKELEFYNNIFKNDNSGNYYYVVQLIGHNLEITIPEIINMIKSLPVTFDYQLNVIKNNDNVYTIAIVRDTNELFTTLEIGEKFIPYQPLGPQFQKLISNTELTDINAEDIINQYIQYSSDNLDLSLPVYLHNLDSLKNNSKSIPINDLNELPIEIQKDLLSFLN